MSEIGPKYNGQLVLEWWGSNRQNRKGKEISIGWVPFFRAWAAYCGVLVELAPHPQEGSLATALPIYTMDLNHFLEKYT